MHADVLISPKFVASQIKNHLATYIYIATYKNHLATYIYRCTQIFS